MSTNNGGPAFPMQDQQAIHAYASAATVGITESEGREDAYIKARAEAVGGMTLRDFFAAKASEADIMAMQHKVPREVDGVTYTDMPPNWRQTARYMHADAMLAERAKGGE